MAKISARGATEVARIKTTNAAGTKFLWVMCSDGRVLYRTTDNLSYTVFRRGIRKESITLSGLVEIATRCGHEVANG